ncbi:hypothetical protein [Streptomyces sp. NPDC018000]|uniref:hypothetical protein n=1 Tax=Streptomyces sp. NPDC018000 TaxID=3365028 RepID=UPI0037B44860
MKSAAAAWLRNRGTQADFDFAQPDGTPLGSVVDIQLAHKRLRVHLDQGVAPEWDSQDEPVLGMSVPVDQDTLIKRWYVHRIRLDSEGTSRRVRIGTEAFARPTEWFSLEECEVTERGLSTPAVERIVQAHSTPEPARWTPGKKQKTSPQDERAQELMRRLLYARRTESPDLTVTVCREITELSGVSPQLQKRLDAAHHSASLRVEKEVESCRTQVSLLDQAVAAQKVSQVKSLIAQAKKATKVDQTGEEEEAIRAAVDYLAAAIPAAIDRLNTILEEVSHIPANGDPELLTRKVQQMSREADELGRVGKGVPHQRAQAVLAIGQILVSGVPPDVAPSDEGAKPGAVPVAQVRGAVELVVFVAVGFGAGEGEHGLGDRSPVVGLVVGAGGEILIAEPGEQLGMGGLAVPLGVGGGQGLRPLTVGAFEQAMRQGSCEAATARMPVTPSRCRARWAGLLNLLGYRAASEPGASGRRPASARSCSVRSGSVTPASS